MSVIRLIVVFVFITVLGCNTNKKVKEKPAEEGPKIAFTFDDGSIKDFPNYELEEWNQLILDHLKKNNVKSVFFATGSFLKGEKGKYVLNSWNNAGHKIANHTYSHPYYHSSKITTEDFQQELLKNDSVIKNYSNYYKYFRYPYLKEGNTIEKRDGFRSFLKNSDYKVGHVTIDASDWYISSRLTNRLKENPDADISGYRSYYIDHIYDRALFYDSLATQLTNRKIKHTLLLHHNLTSALFLDDLIKHFKSKGWEIINADNAFKDSIFNIEPNTIPAGESIVWGLAKQSGKYEDLLRYPAEDSRYEKEKMDKLGL